MALPITDLKKADSTDTNLLMPRVVAQPVVHVWSLTTNPFLADSLIDQLYDLLPHYWTSLGIVDCKMMLAKDRSSCVVIESWGNADAPKAFRLSPAWKKFTRHSSQHMINLVNNTFELIE